jgi:Arc/MetJ family transcription regulator
VHGFQERIMSRTSIDIDDKLIQEGLKITHLKTKKELVNFALQELIKKEKRKRIMEFKGKLQ